MNILLYVNKYLPKIGGREIVVHHLAQELQAFGHNVRVVTHGGYRLNRRFNFGYSVRRYPAFGKLGGKWLFLMQLLYDISYHGCDVVHAHATYPAGYLASLLRSIKCFPLVITPHGEDIQTIPSIGYGMRLNAPLERRIRFALQKADIVTAISSTVEQSLYSAGARGTTLRRIPNGVFFNRFQTSTILNVRAWFGLPNDSKIILSVGNYRPLKGHEILVKSMVSIIKEIPHARLVIVGKNCETLKPLVQEYKLNSKVLLTGPIPFSEIGRGRITQISPSNPDLLTALYLESDVYVSAGVAEGAEGLSLALLEAMASGLPVVATDISGNRDIVHNKKTGILVPPNDVTSLSAAVLKVLRNEFNCTDIGTAAKGLAESYDWPEITRLYLSVYQEALASVRGSIQK